MLKNDWINNNLTESCHVVPYDHNNAIKDVVRILDVAEDAKGQQFEEHFEDKHACEDNIADLQDVCQLFRLWEETEPYFITFCGSMSCQDAAGNATVRTVWVTSSTTFMMAPSHTVILRALYETQHEANGPNDLRIFHRIDKAISQF